MSISIKSMLTTKEDIIYAIDHKMNGDSINSWYIGITNNVRRKLFDELGVNEPNGKWLYSESDADTAKSIKEYFAQRGMQTVDDESDGYIVFVFQKI